MKKRVGLLLIAITICFFSLGCNKTATIDNHIFETDLKSDSGYTWKSLRMDNEYIDNIECLVDDNIVYSKYENGVTNLVFYNYNITDKQTYRLGSIKDPYINSGDVVVVGNEVFFYCNRVVGTEKYPDGKLENSLYKINVGDHKLQKIASDSTDQTLIYVKVCKDKIISLKGKKNKKKSITYLDSYDVSGGKNKKFDILISKDYNRKKENGEVLYNFAVYQSKIYALVRLRNSSGKDSWIIEKYNCAGNYIDSLKLDKKIINLLKNERISKFEMSGKYGFIRTFSGSGVLFRVVSGKTVAKIINKIDLDIAIPGRDKKADYALVYSRDTGEIWNIDSRHNKLNKIDLPYEYLNYLYTDNGKILISSDNTVYGELDSFLTKK